MTKRSGRFERFYNGDIAGATTTVRRGPIGTSDMAASFLFDGEFWKGGVQEGGKGGEGSMKRHLADELLQVLLN